MRKLCLTLFLLWMFLLSGDGGVKVEQNPNLIRPVEEDRELQDEEDTIRGSKNTDESSAGSVDEGAGNIVEWNAPTVYLSHNLYLKQGETLMIKAGTRVIVTGNYRIIVEKQAAIQAIGTSDDPIIFSPDYDFDDISGESLRGEYQEYWLGIRFMEGSSEKKISRFENCHFQNNAPEILSLQENKRNVNGCLIEINGETKIVFNNCIFQGNNYYKNNMISASYCELNFSHCFFSDNRGKIRLDNSVLNMNDCSLSANDYLDIHAEKTSIKISRCNFINNEHFQLHSLNQNGFAIDNSSFCCNNTQNSVILLENISDCSIAKTVIRGNKSVGLESRNSEIFMQRCLISDHGQNYAIMLDADRGKRITRMINCNLAENSYDNGACNINNNIVLIVINSIVYDNGIYDFVIAPNTEGSSFYALNSVIDKKKSLKNDVYRMKAVWEYDIDPKDYQNNKISITNDKGWKDYIQQETEIFSYKSGEYKGISPDIGWKEH